MGESPKSHSSLNTRNYQSISRPGLTIFDGIRPLKCRTRGPSQHPSASTYERLFRPRAY